MKVKALRGYDSRIKPDCKIVAGGIYEIIDQISDRCVLVYVINEKTGHQDTLFITDFIRIV